MADPTAALVWDGTRWVDDGTQVWDGKQWTRPSALFWDGQEWMAQPPNAQEFAAFVSSNSSSYTGKPQASLSVPAETRVNDFVVSICGNMQGFPKLLAPAGHLPQIIKDDTQEISLAVACWPYNGSDTKVIWDLGGSPQATCVNLVYRYGDVLNQSVTPVSDIRVFNNVSKLPLMASKNFMSVFVAMTASTHVTSYQWPTGVVPREGFKGRFGTYEISILTAETPGADASAGDLELNTSVEGAGLYLVTIPGRSDGKPTWILGDSRASVLGNTTYLE
ncbi:hypothetical protein FGW37_05425 [Streptomyces rectiverticillatus]|uniref:hypothetical protein n=1 Tax=Streptomyces rectiverticillatus TaxID=173860 RepID=UPI0015C3F2F6|nr:hypothetical protein [Streptomyces rectiverticillatus]QLE71117.1 hypothetical protein FGW37_05425 [Streptomyces rectiverticillatus]